jgi:hypothetical protein
MVDDTNHAICKITKDIILLYCVVRYVFMVEDMKCETPKITHGSINRLQMKFARGCIICLPFYFDFGPNNCDR